MQMKSYAVNEDGLLSFYLNYLYMLGYNENFKPSMTWPI